MKNKIEYLEDENNNLNYQIEDLHSIIEQCNDNIDYAKSNIGGTYEDLEYGLDNLEECSY